MSVIPMKALLESGVHFGHRTHKWDPGMKPYIFTERNGIHIIDLQQTVKALDQAYNLVRDTVAAGGTVLFVGTKRQAQETIQLEAARCGMPYVTERWLGGMLTNWRTIRARINELERLERMRDTRRVRPPDQERSPASSTARSSAWRCSWAASAAWRACPSCSSSSTSTVKRPPSTKPTCSTSRSSPWSTPTATPATSTTSSPPTTTPSAPSSCWSARSPTPCLEGRAMRKEEEEEPGQGNARCPWLEEAELSDEELLGEATLAKLASRTVLIKSEDEEVEVPFEIEEELEEDAWKRRPQRKRSRKKLKQKRQRNNRHGCIH